MAAAIRRLARSSGEPDSTVMRMAIRFGLPRVKEWVEAMNREVKSGIAYRLESTEASIMNEAPSPKASLGMESKKKAS